MESSRPKAPEEVALEKVHQYRRDQQNKSLNILHISYRGFTQVALHLLAGVIVGMLLGHLTDKIVGTRFLFLCIFTILGAAGGFYNIYKDIKALHGTLPTRDNATTKK